jgi:HSP20 family protein
MRRETLKTTEREPRGTTTVKTAATPETTKGKENVPVMAEHRDMFTMMREMERMMEDTFRRPFMGFDWPIFRHLLPEMGRTGEFAPVVDMYEEGNEVVVKAELPGIKKENVKVNLVENTLTITGEKATEEKVERKDFLRLERTHGTFNRTLTLPEGLKVDQAHAAFNDGVLEIRIPRREEHRTMRTITVE